MVKEDGCQLQRKSNLCREEMGKKKNNRRHYSLFLMHISHPFILARMLNVSLCKIARNTGRGGGVLFISGG